MRQLGTLPDARSARTLAAYLLSQSIETRLDESGDGAVVWVCDEDKVPRARELFQEFLKDPADERYKVAAPVRKEKREASAPRRRVARPQGQWSQPPQYQLTVSLVVLSVIVTMLFHSPPQKAFIASNLFITATKVEGAESGSFPASPE